MIRPDFAFGVPPNPAILREMAEKINELEARLNALETPLIESKPGAPAKRDANSNLSANAFIGTIASTATSAGETVLTAASAPIQIFTGSMTHTVKLPTTGVAAGQAITILNRSSGNVPVQSSGGSTVATLGANHGAKFVALQSTPTVGGHWTYLLQPSLAISTLNTGLTLAQRSLNGLLLAQRMFPATASVRTANGTTTLTNTSAQQQIFTGSDNQTVALPTTGISAGEYFRVINVSTGTITINASGGGTVTSLAAGDSTFVLALQSAPTDASHWHAS